MMQATYDAAGMQGIHDRWGASGVHEFLREWRPRQREMPTRDGAKLTVGAGFCYSHAGGSTYRQHEMGVHIGVSGSSRSGGVFTMTRNDPTYFKAGLERVARGDEFRRGEGLALRVPIANYCFGVTANDAGEVQISRSSEKAETDVITVRFMPGTFSGWGESTAFDTHQVWRLTSLVDEAVEEIKRYTSAKERAERVIARSKSRSDH